jgi:hypothetical protein
MSVRPYRIQRCTACAATLLLRVCSICRALAHALLTIDVRPHEHLHHLLLHTLVQVVVRAPGRSDAAGDAEVLGRARRVARATWCER